LYFTAKVNSPWESLFRSNGRAAGTTVVQNLPAGPFMELTDVAGDLFFVADQGAELWKIEHPSFNLVDLERLDSIYELTAVGDKLFFASYSDLWKSDGTSVGTVFVKFTGGDLSNLFDLNGRLFFAGGSLERFSGNGVELWTSDGTTAGTVEFDLNPDFNEGYGYGSYPANFVEMNGKVFFTAFSGVWTSDGTVAGTKYRRN
jgi:ELWxxDGT repeat protein